MNKIVLKPIKILLILIYIISISKDTIYSSLVSKTSHLSSYIGNIVDQYNNASTGKGSRVYIVEDLHNNIECQLKIERILEYIKKKEGHIDLIGAEGTDGNIDVSLIKGFSKKTQKKIIERLLNQGYITGEEIYAIKNDVRIIGIENQNVYNEAFNTLYKMLEGKENVNEIIDSIKEEIKEVKEQIKLCKKHASTTRRDGSVARLIYDDFKKIKSKYETGKISLEVYIDYLINKPRTGTYKELEKYKNVRNLLKTINHKKLNQEKKEIELKLKGKFEDDLIKYLKENRIDYREYKELKSYEKYLELEKSINKEKLFKELRSLEQEIERRRVLTSTERDLINLEHHLEQKRKYLTNELSSKDVEKYESNQYCKHIAYDSNIQPYCRDARAGVSCDSRSIKTNELIKKILGKQTLKKYESLKPAETLSKKFYNLSTKRDETFIKKTLALDCRDARAGVSKTENTNVNKNLNKNVTKNRIPQSVSTVKVLITGGYHTNSLTQILRTKAIPYTVIRPTITKQQKKDLYRKRLTQQHKIQQSIHIPKIVLTSLRATSIFGYVDDMVNILRRNNLLRDNITEEELIRAMAAQEKIRIIAETEPDFDSTSDVIIFESPRYIKAVIINREQQEMPIMGDEDDTVRKPYSEDHIFDKENEPSENQTSFIVNAIQTYKRKFSIKEPDKRSLKRLLIEDDFISAIKANNSYEINSLVIGQGHRHSNVNPETIIQRKIEEDDSILFLALQNNVDIEMLNYLLNNGAKLKRQLTKEFMQVTLNYLLHKLNNFSYYEVQTILTKLINEDNANDTDPEGNTWLHVLCDQELQGNGYEIIVNRLIFLTDDEILNKLNNDQDTCLYSAMSVNDREFFDYLRSKGAEFNKDIKSEYMKKIVKILCGMNKQQLETYLEEVINSENIRLRDEEDGMKDEDEDEDEDDKGNTWLYHALSLSVDNEQNKENRSIILEHIMELLPEDFLYEEDGRDCLYQAFLNDNNREIINFLVEEEAAQLTQLPPINKMQKSRRKFMRKVLVYLLEDKGDKQVIDFINETTIFLTDENSNTWLHHFCNMQPVTGGNQAELILQEIIEIAQEQGDWTFKDKQNNNQETCLHIAIKSELSTRLLFDLIDIYRLKLDIKDKYGNTPFDIYCSKVTEPTKRKYKEDYKLFLYAFLAMVNLEKYFPKVKGINQEDLGDILIKSKYLKLHSFELLNNAIYQTLVYRYIKKDEEEKKKREQEAKKRRRKEEQEDSEDEEESIEDEEEEIRDELVSDNIFQGKTRLQIAVQADDVDLVNLIIQGEDVFRRLERLALDITHKDLEIITNMPFEELQLKDEILGLWIDRTMGDLSEDWKEKRYQDFKAACELGNKRAAKTLLNGALGDFKKKKVKNKDSIMKDEDEDEDVYGHVQKRKHEEIVQFVKEKIKEEDFHRDIVLNKNNHFLLVLYDLDLLPDNMLHFLINSIHRITSSPFFRTEKALKKLMQNLLRKRDTLFQDFNSATVLYNFAMYLEDTEILDDFIRLQTSRIIPSVEQKDFNHALLLAAEYKNESVLRWFLKKVSNKELNLDLNNIPGTLAYILQNVTDTNILDQLLKLGAFAGLADVIEDDSASGRKNYNPVVVDWLLKKLKNKSVSRQDDEQDEDGSKIDLGSLDQLFVFIRSIRDKDLVEQAVDMCRMHFNVSGNEEKERLRRFFLFGEEAAIITVINEYKYDRHFDDIQVLCMILENKNFTNVEFVESQILKLDCLNSDILAKREDFWNRLLYKGLIGRGDDIFYNCIVKNMKKAKVSIRDKISDFKTFDSRMTARKKLAEKIKDKNTLRDFIDLNVNIHGRIESEHGETLLQCIVYENIMNFDFIKQLIEDFELDYDPMVGSHAIYDDYSKLIDKYLKFFRDELDYAPAYIAKIREMIGFLLDNGLVTLSNVDRIFENFSDEEPSFKDVFIARNPDYMSDLIPLSNFLTELCLTLMTSSEIEYRDFYETIRVKMQKISPVFFEKFEEFLTNILLDHREEQSQDGEEIKLQEIEIEEISQEMIEEFLEGYTDNPDSTNIYILDFIIIDILSTMLTESETRSVFSFKGKKRKRDEDALLGLICGVMKSTKKRKIEKEIDQKEKGLSKKRKRSMLHGRDQEETERTRKKRLITHKKIVVDVNDEKEKMEDEDDDDEEDDDFYDKKMEDEDEDEDEEEGYFHDKKMEDEDEDEEEEDDDKDPFILRYAKKMELADKYIDSLKRIYLMYELQPLYKTHVIIDKEAVLSTTFSLPIPGKPLENLNTSKIVELPYAFNDDEENFDDELPYAFNDDEDDDEDEDEMKDLPRDSAQLNMYEKRIFKKYLLKDFQRYERKMLREKNITDQSKLIHDYKFKHAILSKDTTADDILNDPNKLLYVIMQLYRFDIMHPGFENDRLQFVEKYVIKNFLDEIGVDYSGSKDVFLELIKNNKILNSNKDILNYAVMLICQGNKRILEQRIQGYLIDGKEDKIVYEIKELFRLFRGKISKKVELAIVKHIIEVLKKQRRFDLIPKIRIVCNNYLDIVKMISDLVCKDYISMSKKNSREGLEQNKKIYYIDVDSLYKQDLFQYYFDTLEYVLKTQSNLIIKSCRKDANNSYDIFSFVFKSNLKEKFVLQVKEKRVFDQDLCLGFIINLYFSGYSCLKNRISKHLRNQARNQIGNQGRERLEKKIEAFNKFFKNYYAKIRDYSFKFAIKYGTSYFSYILEDLKLERDDSKQIPDQEKLKNRKKTLHFLMNESKDSKRYEHKEKYIENHGNILILDEGKYAWGEKAIIDKDDNVIINETYNIDNDQDLKLRDELYYKLHKEIEKKVSTEEIKEKQFRQSQSMADEDEEEEDEDEFENFLKAKKRPRNDDSVQDEKFERRGKRRKKAVKDPFELTFEDDEEKRRTEERKKFYKEHEEIEKKLDEYKKEPKQQVVDKKDSDIESIRIKKERLRINFKPATKNLEQVFAVLKKLYDKEKIEELISQIVSKKIIEEKIKLEHSDIVEVMIRRHKNKFYKGFKQIEESLLMISYINENPEDYLTKEEGLKIFDTLIKEIVMLSNKYFYTDLGYKDVMQAVWNSFEGIKKQLRINGKNFRVSSQEFKDRVEYLFYNRKVTLYKNGEVEIGEKLIDLVELVDIKSERLKDHIPFLIDRFQKIESSFKNILKISWRELCDLFIKEDIEMYSKAIQKIVHAA